MIHGFRGRRRRLPGPLFETRFGTPFGSLLRRLFSRIRRALFGGFRTLRTLGGRRLVLTRTRPRPVSATARRRADDAPHLHLDALHALDGGAERGGIRGIVEAVGQGAGVVADGQHAIVERDGHGLCRHDAHGNVVLAGVLDDLRPRFAQRLQVIA